MSPKYYYIYTICGVFNSNHLNILYHDVRNILYVSKRIFSRLTPIHKLGMVRVKSKRSHKNFILFFWYKRREICTRKNCGANRANCINF